MKTAVYPGTFDPITNGHLDVVKRAAKAFDRVILAVAEDNYKNNLFSLKERLELVKSSTANIPNVEAYAFCGLLVNFCQEQNANIIIRGMRAVSDFEQELQMALMNRKLKPDIDTVFFVSAPEYLYLSSSIIKSAFSLKGDICGLVPSCVIEALKGKFPVS